MNKSNRFLNGYILVYQPTHPKAMKGGNWDGYVYEHILMAEKSQNTTLNDDEVVHHLDGNPGNNSPDNLLIMRETSHGKLHGWMEKNIIVAKPSYALRKLKGCVRCLECNEPINYGETFCSVICSGKARRKVERPNETTLIEDIGNLSLSAIGRKYGVSDNAIRKWCDSLGIDYRLIKST